MDRITEPNLIQTIKTQKGEVTCVDAFGGWLGIGGGDRSVRVFRWMVGDGWVSDNVVNGAHRYGVTVARWSPAGMLLATGGVDGVTRVWSRSLESRRVLAAAGAAATRSVCWAGVRLLAGHDDGALHIWHVPRTLLLRRLLAHEGALHAVATPGNCALVLTACTEGVLKVFDLVEVCRNESEAAPAPLLWVDGAHDLGAMCADAETGGRRAATGGHDARIRLWVSHLDDGRWSMSDDGCLEGHSDTVTAVRWGGSGTSTLLASASLDRSARLWLPDAKTCLHVVAAHPRYLTCIALAPDLLYMLTGSNDKSVRMWSLGSLTVDDVLEPPCHPLAHFGLGDLEGIEPINEDEENEATEADSQMNMLQLDGEKEDGAVGGAVGGGDATRIWQKELSSAVNCIAVQGNIIATASSDGFVRIFRWEGLLETATTLHEIPAHEYPALACDVGASGALVLSAGQDARAHLWDVQMGVCLRSLPAGGAGRGARVSPRRPPLLLLATDDARAPIWSLQDNDPHPIHVFEDYAEAVWCCAWSCDGRVAATGAADGVMALLSPPPCARLLLSQPAHELGVQSCDFAPAGVLNLPESSYALASAGGDSFVKLWIVELDEDAMEVRMTLAASVHAHGSSASCVRWGDGGLLASAGGDRWARVWRATKEAVGTEERGEDGIELRAVGAAPADCAGGAPAVALLPTTDNQPLLAVGTLSGDLSVWRLATDDGDDPDDGELPRFWDEKGTARWLREYVTRAPGMPKEALVIEQSLIKAVKEHQVTGSRLLDDDEEKLLNSLGYDEEHGWREQDGAEALRTRLIDELYWLRRPPPPASLVWSAPHSLLCSVSHRVVSGAARGAGGEARLALAPHPASLTPNYKLTAQLRHYLLSLTEQ